MNNKRYEKMEKDLVSNPLYGDLLDRVINNPLMLDFDGVLTPQTVGDEVIIYLDDEKLATLPISDLEDNMVDIVKDVCAEILLKKNMGKFTMHILDVLSDMIHSSYGDMKSLVGSKNLLNFELNKDGKPHTIKLIPKRFNVKVYFDGKDTGILIPDLVGEFFDYNTCYLDRDVPYDESCVDNLALNYLQ